MDALDRVEEWAAKEYQILPPGPAADVRDVCRELRAAREAVKEPYRRSQIRRNFYHEIWDDALEMVSKKMKEAQNG